MNPTAQAAGAGVWAAHAAPAQRACTACGKPNRAGARFCRSCGQAMAAGVAAVPVAARPAPPDRPAVPTTPPAQPRRPAWLGLVLAALLAVAALWWLRGGAPAEPVEEFLTDPAPAASAADPAAPAATAEPPPVADPAASAPTAAPAWPAPAPGATTGKATTAASVEQVSPLPVPPQTPTQTQPPSQPQPPAAPQRAPATQRAAPAPTTAARAGPEAGCTDSSAFTRPFCLSLQCIKSEFRQHPTCVRLENETRERRQREIDQGLVGG